MINANELRLGNALEYLVEDCVDNSSEWMLNIVDAADIVDAASNESIFNKYYQPIPITPEILEKCGFVRNSLMDSYELGKYSVRYSMMYYEGHEVSELNTCKYLHQLQNLYFALTGEELNYTP